MKTNFDFVKCISWINDKYNHSIYLFNLKLMLKTYKYFYQVFIFLQIPTKDVKWGSRKMQSSHPRSYKSRGIVSNIQTGVGYCCKQEKLRTISGIV